MHVVVLKQLWPRMSRHIMEEQKLKNHRDIIQKIPMLTVCLVDIGSQRLTY